MKGLSLPLILLFIIVQFSSNCFVYADSVGGTEVIQINTNTYYNNTIESIRDEDWYAFTIKTPGYIQVDYTGFGNPDFELRYFDKKTIIFAEGLSSEGENKATHTTHQRIGLDTGTYYFRIRGISNETVETNNYGNYKFRIRYKSTSSWETEPNSGTLVNDNFNKDNDNKRLADKIALNTVYYGSLSSNKESEQSEFYYDDNDRDYYRFIINKDGPVNVWLEGVSVCSIWTENGKSIFSDIVFDNEKETQLIWLEKGIYYLCISASNVLRGEKNAEYSFRVNYGASNVLGTIARVKVNNKYKNQSPGYAGFRFSLDKHGKTSISFEGKGTVEGPRRLAYIYKLADNDAILEDRWTGDINHKSKQLILEKGDYYLVVDYEEIFSPFTPEKYRKNVESFYSFRINVEDTDISAPSNHNSPNQENDQQRVYGANRFETAYNISDRYKETSSVSKLNAIIVSTGNNYPDALGGAYLAKVKKAPIIITSPSEENRTIKYISNNVTTDGTVYILGGTGVVSKTFENKIKANGRKVVRIGGKTRYETNLQILEKSGNLGQELIVVTGGNFPDALSASAAGRPILIVGKTLTQNQIDLLRKNKFKTITIIGGTGVVSKTMENALSSYGNVNRINGKNRYETSAKVAQKYFENTKYVVLATGKNYPDALTGGPLALIQNAPMILISNNAVDYAFAKSYIQNVKAKNYTVLGGTGIISDTAVLNIM